jgi:DNA-directed RNA polymerase subunit omega
VVSLREIAEGHLYPDHLRQSVVKGLQKHVTLDEEEQDVLNLLAEEQGLSEQLGLGAQTLEGEGLTITEGTPEQGE